MQKVKLYTKEEIQELIASNYWIEEYNSIEYLEEQGYINWCPLSQKYWIW